MFIELAEFLRCPGSHADAYCVVAAEHMKGRAIVSGTVGCPVCKAEYPITHEVVELGDHPLCDDGYRADDLTLGSGPDAPTIQALLSLDGPGGYVVFVGSASRLAAELATLIDGVHFVGVNVPPDVRPTPSLSVLTATATIPLRTFMARGALVSREYTAEPWVAEAARVLGPGARVVIMGDVPTTAGLRQLATAKGLWVGERASPDQS